MKQSGVCVSAISCESQLNEDEKTKDDCEFVQIDNFNLLASCKNWNEENSSKHSTLSTVNIYKDSGQILLQEKFKTQKVVSFTSRRKKRSSSSTASPIQSASLSIS